MIPSDEKPTHFAGFDWARKHHDILVTDTSGNTVLEFRFEHSAEGWNLCRQKLAGFSRLAVAIEAGNSDATERLVLMGCSVYPVHPRTAKSFRARKRPSGTKTDKIDCLSLADALRFEGENWAPLTLPEPLVQQLKIMCRDEVALIAQRTALVNQLIQTLYEYYPIALEAFDDWTSPAPWAFIATFPTPKTLIDAGKRKWEKFLHANRLYNPHTWEKRLKLFAQAQQFCGSEPVITAKSILAVTLVNLLQTLENQLRKYREEILACFRRHPAHVIFDSLPGAGPKLAPRLLSELVSCPEITADPQRLQAFAGMAPVSYQSGQISCVYVRHLCNRNLRHTVHLWADLSRHFCDWARIYYQAHRAKGKSHACALRSLGMRWLKIVSAMVRTQTPYNAVLHSKNQLQHGSWILKLEATPSAHPSQLHPKENH